MVIDVRPLQLLKAPPSIFVTLSGIIVVEHPAINLLVFVSIIALQLLRESYIALFSATTIEVRPLHLQYLQPIITQYFIDNKSEIWLLFLIAHSKR